MPGGHRLVNSMLWTSLAAMTRDTLRASMFALLLCSTPLAGQRRVIDAVGIANAGWHRVGEIVSALPPGTTASVDGFNHALTGSRVGFMEASRSTAGWMVRLDGQTMPVSVAGLWILDAIPVAITQVDSIVITEGPGIVDGRSVFLGTIELFTRRPLKGFSAIADYQHGDESGDPGPYRYTPRGGPNVEKLGPFASAAAAFRGERVALDVAGRYSSLNITDERIVSRFPGAFGSLQSDVNASGGSGVLTMHIAGGDHYVVAGRGRFTGLMHLPAYRSDQSGRAITSHVGISGAMLVKALPLRYAVAATQIELNPLGTAMPFTLEQDRRTGDAFIEAAPFAGRFRVGAGLNIGRQVVPIFIYQRRTDRGWVTYSGVRETATLAVERALSSAKFAGTFRHERQLADSETVAISLTAISSWVDADNAWMDGFGTSTTHGRSTGIGDLRIEIATRDFLQFRPTWYGRGFMLANLARSGEAFGLAAGVVATTALARRTTASVRGEISQSIGDSYPGESSMPGGFIEAGASTTTPGNFRLAVSGRYAPKTVWPPLELGAPAEVPATQRVDFSVNKTLWHDRVRGQLVMRNMLNAAERTHPFGAQWNLRTHLAVTIALPPLPVAATR